MLWLLVSWLLVVNSQETSPPEQELVEVDDFVTSVELSTTGDPARAEDVITIIVDAASGLESCGILVNNVDVGDSLVVDHRTYTLTYTVKAGDEGWSGGELPLAICLTKDYSYQMITACTDGNAVAGDVHEPTASSYIPMSAKLVAGFIFSLMCSYLFGYAIKSTGIPLPMVTAYIVAGIIAGPSILGFISEDEIRSLRFIDEATLAFIALEAGSKMHVASLQSRIKPIAMVALSMAVLEFSISVAVVYALSSYADFMTGMTSYQTFAAACLTASLALARSPASSIAVIREVGAKGPFTSLTLGVTILMDLFVIEFFSIVFTALRFGLEEGTDDVPVWQLWLRPAVIFMCSLIAGFLVHIMIRLILMEIPDHKHSLLWQYLQGFMVVMVGFATVLTGHLCGELVDPLIACMAAGYMIVNYSDKRQRLMAVEEDWSEVVYIFLFTLTGAALALDALGATVLIALAVFAARLAGMYSGSYVGGILAGEPSFNNKVSFMAYMTQAGVALGLAKKVQLEYAWGGQFAAVIVTVVLLNQMLGPPLHRLSLRLVKEDAESRDRCIVWVVGDDDGVSISLPSLIREQRAVFDHGATLFEVRYIALESLVSSMDDTDRLTTGDCTYNVVNVNRIFADMCAFHTIVLVLPEDCAFSLVKFFRDPNGGQLSKDTKIFASVKSHIAMTTMYAAGALPVVIDLDSTQESVSEFVDIVVALMGSTPQLLTKEGPPSYTDYLGGDAHAASEATQT